MRRLPALALVCALLCLLLGAGPALAVVSHHRHPHHPATKAAHTSTAGTRSTVGTSSTAGTLAASSGPATTKDGLKVLNDCQTHGQLTRAYPASWLHKALSMMSSDTAQYSNCSTVLHQALLHSIHGDSGGSGGSGGSGTTTIVIIVVVVLIILAALLGVLALRRRRGGGGPPPAVA